MNIVITGGTGLIGRHLIPRLLELGHQITVVTRNPQKASSVLGPRVTLWQGLADQSNLNGVDAVINLPMVSLLMKLPRRLLPYSFTKQRSLLSQRAVPNFVILRQTTTR